MWSICVSQDPATNTALFYAQARDKGVNFPAAIFVGLRFALDCGYCKHILCALCQETCRRAHDMSTVVCIIPATRWEILQHDNNR